MSESRPEHYPFFFTWTSQSKAEPLHLLGGEGAYFDTNEGRFLDFGSLIYQAYAGHGNQTIVQAVCEQAQRLCLATPAAIYPEKVALAHRLLALAPEGFTKIFFTLGGSEANENAFKMARMFTGRHKAISRYRSYHGATLGAASLTGDWRRRPAEPAVAGVVHVLDLDEASGRAGASDIARVLELEGDVGVVFLETIVGHNGVLIPPAGHLREVREACDAHGALLVLDEVLCGCGRTGRFFAFEHFDGVVPDLITLGKGLTAGYGALGAVLVHDRVARHFDENILAAGLTHYAHPLGVAAALAALDLYAEEGWIAEARTKGEHLLAGLQALVDAHPAIARGARGLGLLAAIDLTLDPAAWHELQQDLRRRRLHVHGNAKVGTLIVAPPLCISEAELDDGLGRLGEALRAIDVA